MLQSTFSADGSSADFRSSSGRAFVHVDDGTFGGGTLVLEILLGSTWSTLENASWTSGPVSKIIDLPGNVSARLTLSGATSPSLAYLINPSQ